LWARDAERQAAFYGELFNWEVGAGLIMQMPAGLGGLEPGLGGHIRRGDSPAVILDVQVRDLRASLARAAVRQRSRHRALRHPRRPDARCRRGQPLVLVQQ
jgi:predicted enzyme related to lactoylglutathione lyase